MNDGKCYLLPLEFGGSKIVARQYKGYFRFYCIPVSEDNLVASIDERFAFYGNYVHKSLPREAGWSVIGKRVWELKELERVPYLFRQDRFNYQYCLLVHPTELEAIKAEVENCIGLERAIVFGSWENLRNTLIARITGKSYEPWDEVYRLKIPGVDTPKE